MNFLLTLMIPLAGLVALATYIWLTVIAFRRSAGWGVAVLLLSPFSLVFFAISYWQESKRPFLIHAGSVCAIFVAVVMLFNAVGGFHMLSAMNKLQSGEMSEDEIPDLIRTQIEIMENSGLLSDEDRAQLQELKDELARLEAQNAGTEIDSAETNANYESLMAQARTPIEPVRDVTETEPSWMQDLGSGASGGSNGAALSSPSALPGAGGRIKLRDADEYVGSAFVIGVKGGQKLKGHLTGVERDRLTFERHVSGGAISFDVAKNEVDTLKLRGR